MAIAITAAEFNAYVTPFSADDSDAGARTRYEWRGGGRFTGGAGEPRAEDGGLFPRVTRTARREDDGGPLVVFSPANIGKRVFEILDDTKVACVIEQALRPR